MRYPDILDEKKGKVFHYHGVLKPAELAYSAVGCVAVKRKDYPNPWGRHSPLGTQA